MLKDALLQAFGRTRLSYLQQLDSIRQDGRRLSALLAHMQALNTASGMPIPEALLRDRHLQLLPADLRLHLAALPDNMKLQDYIQKADVLFDVYTHASNPAPSPLLPGPALDPAGQQCSAVTTARQSTVYNDVPAALLSRIDNLERNLSRQCTPAPQNPDRLSVVLEALVSRMDRLETRLSVRNSSVNDDSVCFYHSRFGVRARRCESPCTWQGNDQRGGR